MKSLTFIFATFHLRQLFQITEIQIHLTSSLKILIIDTHIYVYIMYTYIIYKLHIYNEVYIYINIIHIHTRKQTEMGVEKEGQNGIHREGNLLIKYMDFGYNL